MIQICDIINRHVLRKSKSSNLESLDFHVRWNTTYLMLERFHILKVIVDELTCNPQIIEGIKKCHLDKIRKINFKQEDWNTIIILIKLLKPFYKASVMLQGQKYHSLSMSKVIEKTLIAYYKQISDSSDSYLEIAISDKLNKYVKKYLVDKISPAQKVLSLVIKN